MKRFEITTVADDRKAGLSLGQLYEFVREAMAAGVDLESRPEVRVGWRGQLQKITVDGQTTDSVRTVDLDGPGDG